ncbi:MAG: NAD(+) diphosphatase [Gemmobacter sp.]|uniref:NAD(+) diphosphatase n=1 Tax=Gemmobacter sp. TaxID=1898957 RepID=UPI001A5172C3|nr:NAD(+) diphosphatase [Gemmobacter sp.]MBL8561646.1 NAD(+) diphosphatase [Gemmobacter sp.]
MRQAETVTFGGPPAGQALERAAHLRGDVAAQARLLASGRVLPLWRGKPLLTGEGAALGWLPPGHPALAHGRAPLFLGLAAGGEQGLFAQDISDWTPEAGSEAVEQGFFDASIQRHPALPGDHSFHELRGVMTRLDATEAALAATARALLHWHRSHGFCATCGSASDLAMAGWQRNCPSCGAQHFPRTDPVVIMLVTHGNRALLGRSPGWPEGMYSCLAGFVEPGETIEAAVRREVLEEAGIHIGAVRYLASQPWPFPASLMIGCAAEALTDTITRDPAELEDAIWLTREEALATLSGERSDILPARKGAIAHFLLSNWLADRLD